MWWSWQIYFSLKNPQASLQLRMPIDHAPTHFAPFSTVLRFREMKNDLISYLTLRRSFEQAVYRLQRYIHGMTLA
jgi:hypothetical protein